MILSLVRPTHFCRFLSYLTTFCGGEFLCSGWPAFQPSEATEGGSGLVDWDGRVRGGFDDLMGQLVDVWLLGSFWHTRSMPERLSSWQEVRISN